jgi:hypothetical protein
MPLGNSAIGGSGCSSWTTSRAQGRLTGQSNGSRVLQCGRYNHDAVVQFAARSPFSRLFFFGRRHHSRKRQRLHPQFSAPTHGNGTGVFSLLVFGLLADFLEGLTLRAPKVFFQLPGRAVPNSMGQGTVNGNFVEVRTAEANQLGVGIGKSRPCSPDRWEKRYPGTCGISRTGIGLDFLLWVEFYGNLQDVSGQVR